MAIDNRQRFADAFYMEAEGIDCDRNARNIVVKNHIKNAMCKDLDVDSATDLYIDNVFIENCSGNGLHISDPQPPRYCNVSNVTVINCAKDLRSAGVILGVCSLNITDLIIKDCLRDILQNREAIPTDKKEHTNITNLHISSSAREDIVVTSDASGLNIITLLLKKQPLIYTQLQ